MSKTKSLKYLILDTINKFKNSNNSELINKIQNSLNVEDHNTNYKITWKTNNINTSIIPKGDFKFYERNDMINYENNSNYLEINNKSAEKLIEKILNTKEKKQEKHAARPPEPPRRVHVCVQIMQMNSDNAMPTTRAQNTCW
jgi:hypothetical protein